jgi:hypothetical protein
MLSATHESNDKRCYIKDIQLGETNPYTIYGLMVKIGSRYRTGGPDSIHITDFTTNMDIANPVKPKPFLSQQVTLKDEQILTVDALRKPLLAIEYLYKERYHHDIGLLEFLNSGDRFLMIAHKLVLLKLRLKPKVYRGTIEPQVLLFLIVNEATEDDVGKQFIRQLYGNISTLPAEFFDPALRDLIVPSSYFKQSNWDPDIDSQDVSSQPFQSAQSHPKLYSDSESDSESLEYESQVRSQLSQLQSQANLQSISNSHTNSNSTSSSIKIYATQAAQVVKAEVDLDDSLVPDTEFQNDYISSPSGMEGETLFQVPNTNREKSIYKINELNQIDTHLDNKIYKTKGYIIGTNPTDWSHVCAKSYEYNNISNKYELTDPALRSLEFIVTDIQSQDARYLSQDDFLTVKLTEKSLASFFEEASIEEIYTSISKVNSKLYEAGVHRKLRELELYKTEIEINPETHDKISTWTIHNFTLSDLCKI